MEEHFTVMHGLKCSHLCVLCPYGASKPSRPGGQFGETLKGEYDWPRAGQGRYQHLQELETCIEISRTIDENRALGGGQTQRGKEKGDKTGMAQNRFLYPRLRGAATHPYVCWCEITDTRSGGLGGPFTQICRWISETIYARRGKSLPAPSKLSSGTGWDLAGLGSNSKLLPVRFVVWYFLFGGEIAGDWLQLFCCRVASHCVGGPS